MFLHRSAAFVLASIVAVAGFGVHAAELGDDAADLSIAKWIKGDAVNIADGENEKIHVVEFWATWCGPCRTSIPHLTELQEKFKDDVVFVGISDETEAEVAPFVENMGTKMDYRVAIDEGRKTSAGYMQAYGQSGIPTAFVVDTNGKVAWVGHPMAQLETVLEQMVAGTYDVESMKRATEAEGMLPQFASYLMSEDEADFEKADEIGARIVELAAGNPELLNRIAWALLTDPSIKYRNNDLAMSAARTAYEVTKGQDSSVLDTYARGFYETGDLEQAITFQKMAVEKAGNPGMKEELQKALDKYQAESR